MSNLAGLRWVRFAARLSFLWCISFDIVFTLLGTPYARMSSGTCKAAWKLKVLKPIPSVRFPTRFVIIITSFIFVFNRSTDSTFSDGCISQASICRRVSRSMIQSWINTSRPKNSLCFPLLSCNSVSLPFVDLNVARSTSINPVISWPMSLPFLMPLLNLVLGNSRSLCRWNRYPIIDAIALILPVRIDLSPVWPKNMPLTYLYDPIRIQCNTSRGHAPWTP